MKILTYLLALSIIVAICGIFAFTSMLIFTVKATEAEEYSPLDFLDGVDRFEVIVGLDNNAGRYITYHYEYAD